MATLRDFRGIEGTDFFDQDAGFQTLLRTLTQSGADIIFAALHECALLVSGRWNTLAIEANRHENLPSIERLDRVGNPVEKIIFPPEARQLRREVAEFGVLTRSTSELHKFATVYLLAHNAEASLTCGLSCTDGLIRAIEASGSGFLKDFYLPRLRSDETPLAGAQFVTEQAGGSDVGAIETTATPIDDRSWAIRGEKWFCSNPDEYFLVAARPEGARAGTDGVAIFFVPRVMPDGQVNNLSFRRLKDKLGTRSLPTAEIDFHGAIGYPIGDVDDGFKTLMNYVINVSRIHNAVNACGILHRAFLESRNYARRREAFGRGIISYPLVQETLAGLLERLWRVRLLTFQLVVLVDSNGIAPADPHQAMWQRFLINLAKYRTSSILTNSVREAILVLGGNGIVEDFSVLPRLLRDSLIIETWEGTHNTLCLQIMRDGARSDLLGRWAEEVAQALDFWPRGFLNLTRHRLEDTFSKTTTLIEQGKPFDTDWAAVHARRFVDQLGFVLELAWMGRMAAGLRTVDSTAGVLASLASYNSTKSEDPFNHPVLTVLGRESFGLIEEQPLRIDLENL